MHTSIAALKRDNHFAPLIKKHGIPDIARTGKPFQALVRAIIGQQVSGAAARSIFAKFVSLFPKAPPGGGFPTPKMVQAIPTKKLRTAGLSGQKASYIKDLAQKFSDGTIKHRSLHRMESAEIVEHLTQVKGIGVWTVHMFLIFTLRRPDVLPTGDLGIRKGFQILYKLKDLPNHAQMEQLARPWRAHASSASWYFWRIADSARPKPRAKEGEARVKVRPAVLRKRLKSK